SCGSTVAVVTNVIKNTAIGLEGNRLALTLTAGSNSIDCASLPACQAQTGSWPPAPYNAVGQQVTIRARYVFASVLSSFWPGQSGGTIPLTAQATETIQF